MISLEDLKRYYSLPSEVFAALHDRQIQHLLYPQEAALKAGVLDGKSILLASGSSTGKTLVAEFAIAKLSAPRKALYLVPLKSIADEKYDEFRKYYANLLSIGVSTHDKDEYDNRLQELDLLVATYEKAAILLRSNLSWGKSIGLLVVDELQHLGDANRGPILEILITELLRNSNLQFLGLSATIAEAQTFKKWIGNDLAVLEFPNFRAVPLRMGVVHGGKIMYQDGEFEETQIKGSLEAQLVQLVIKEVESAHQVLVFTHSKYSTEKYAQLLAEGLSRVELPGVKRLTDSEIQKFVSQDAVSTDVRPSLAECLAKGVAYHNAGLTASERTFIQDSFKAKRLAAVCATTTLAEGVNYPADTTIFSSLSKGQEELSVNDFKNMAGRAGRVGYVKAGVALVIAPTQRMARDAMDRYINGTPQVVLSQLLYEKDLRRNLMALIATGTYKSLEQMMDFLSRTYYARFTGSPISRDVISRLYQSLETGGLSKNYRATELGRVCASRLYDPLTVQRVVDGFRLVFKERRPMSDFTLLHMVCSLSDFENTLFPVMDWERGTFTGVVVERGSEIIPTSYNDQTHLEQVNKTALVLETWTQGRETEKFKVFASDAQTNQAQTAMWLLSVIPDCLEAIGLPIDQDLIGQLGELMEKLKYGVPKKFLAVARTFSLLGIDPLSRKRILRLGEEGISTLGAIADSALQTLSAALGSTEFARAIQRKTSEILNDPLMKQRQALILEAEKNGLQGPVLRLFLADSGEEYERSVYQILRSMTKSIGRPQGDKSTSPDFIIATRDGKAISIETRSTTHEVEVSQLGAVLTRSLNQKSCVAAAIIAKRFSPEAVATAKNTREGAKLTLVTDAVLAKGLIMGRVVDPESLLLSILTAGGLPTEDDVKRLSKSIHSRPDVNLISTFLRDEHGPKIGPKEVSKDRLESALRGKSDE